MPKLRQSDVDLARQDKMRSAHDKMSGLRTGAEFIDCMYEPPLSSFKFLMKLITIKL